MKIKIHKSTIEISNNHDAVDDLNVIFGFEHDILTNGKKLIKPIHNISLIDLDKTPGKHHLHNDGTKLFLLLSLGNKEDFNLENYLKALKSLAAFLTANQKIATVNLITEEQLAKALKFDIEYYFEQTMFHLINYLYYFDEQKSTYKTLKLKHINVMSKQDHSATIKKSIYLAESVFLLKHLANNPANVITPSYMAKTAQSLSKLSKKVKVEILDKKEIKKENMHSFLAVAQGSDEDPKFIKLEYNGAHQDKKPIVLIGKGITFDSGGISLKPSANMDAMKYDMCGAATVISAFAAAVKLELPINLVTLVPTCDNMPSGKAVKPGDVVITRSGQTVEILNTDAEGRLILCDALSYAETYNPELVIDIATLTGGCITALGTIASALYSNDEALAKKLIHAANITEDKVWQMPLFKEYHDMLKGTTADIANIAGWKGHASSPTAACFLEKFVNYKWAHLDIAGVADGTSIFNSHEYQGSTGRPFYMLMEFLRHQL
ncbi:MAG: leucyl aminopeptidase [Proteobacteria bacterium]|jgi:leucyl aminopeptidase|nr:leucyl aminopeptidase [Pseudomonadota bacterium]